MDILKKQIVNFPHLPGVYFFKDEKGKILYIGKAADLKSRVAQYFQREVESRPKLESMINGEAKRIDYVKTESEIEALLLESEMIKRYKPKYNQRWKDEKNFVWIEVTQSDEWPKVFIVRRPIPNKNIYLGPFVDATSVKNTLKILRRIFPFITSNKFPHRLCFWGHLKQCPCSGVDNKSYKKDIKSLLSFLKGKRKGVIVSLEKEMKNASKNYDYERAASLRDRVFSLKKVSEMIISSRKDNDLLRSDQALGELRVRLGMVSVPARIECYDISNLFGRNATGSMTVFTNGIPDKSSYRRFKIKKVKEINDYAMMKEMLTRRFLKSKDERFGVLPDLIVVDGGKGQLSAAKSILDEFKLKIEIIGLAKKNEEVFIYNKGKEAGILEGTFKKILLERDSYALFLLERIRDEAHRFAIIHHRLLRDKKNLTSQLEEIGGVGAVTSKKLIKSFKSIENIKKANINDIAFVVGKERAVVIKNFLSKV